MEFNKVKLGEIIDFKNGRKRPKEDGEIPVYGGNGILGYTNQSNSIKNSLIIGRVGAYCGCVYKNDGECWISDNAIVGYPKEGNDYKYLYYYLKSLKLNSLHIGSSHPLMTQDILNNIEVQIPEYSEQVKIGNFLSGIDKKIESNSNINDSLYEITNSLYEELFIKDRKEDWKEYNLLDLAEVVNGYSYAGKELVDISEIGMATIKNFNRYGGFKTEGFKSIKPIKSKEYHYAEKFDILVACTDLTQNAEIIGNAVMLLNKREFKKIIISMDLVKMIPKHNRYLVYSILNSKEFKNYALGYKTGTTVLHLNKDCFKNYNIKLPEENIINKFVDVATANYNKISKNLEENDVLEGLKEILIPKLINGKLVLGE